MGYVLKNSNETVNQILHNSKGIDKVMKLLYEERVRCEANDELENMEDFGIAMDELADAYCKYLEVVKEISINCDIEHCGPCLHCGSTNTGVEEVDIWGQGPGGLYQGICRNCRMSAPTRKSRSEAADAWNNTT